MNFSFGDPLIDTRTRAFDDFEEVDKKLNFTDDDIAQIKDSKELIVIEASYLPHFNEIQSFMSSKAFFSTSSFKLFKDAGKLLCLAFSDRTDYQPFLDKILPSLKSSACKVSVISFNMLNAYKTEDAVDSCILRCLTSTKVQDIPPLETPNFISGLSASIATYGKFHDFPFTAYILYANDLDQDCIKKLSSVLNKLSLKLNLKAKATSLANSLYI